ncbi:MAG: DUF4416 family protein [bacterium]|nr:MAG: DUF4416 family protein [bacterium]
MGRERVPLPVRLVMGILWTTDGDLRSAMRQTEELFGPVAKKSPSVPFDPYTPYYGEEMGGELKRCYWSFVEVVPQGVLPEIKLATNRIETDMASEGRRRVNLDPGLVTLDALVLATTKPYYHRTYLGKGIYADLTLVYRNGSFEALPWTYPDYREQWVRDFFLQVRSELKRDRRGGGERT